MQLKKYINSSQEKTKDTIHTLTPLKEGTVTVTGTPWDLTSTAKPISFEVSVGESQGPSVDFDKLVKD